MKVITSSLKEIFAWPDREIILARTPMQLHKYPNCYTRVIIDCTKLDQCPTSLLSQAVTFSHYKHHNTFIEKALVGPSPGGVFTCF